MRTVCLGLGAIGAVATLPWIVTLPLTVSTLAPLTLKPSIVRRAILDLVVIQESLTSARAATALGHDHGPDERNRNCNLLH